MAVENDEDAKSYRWYVVQTLKGRERSDAGHIQEDVISADEEAFVFENEREFRINKEWVKELEPLFPGYIFVITRDIEDFAARLRRSKHRLRILEVEGAAVPIREDEEAYLKRIGGEDHIARYSEGIRIGDRIEIESGAFAGWSGEVRKLDRHNRWASIILPLMGTDMEVKIGLGIVKNYPARA